MSLLKKIGGIFTGQAAAPPQQPSAPAPVVAAPARPRPAPVTSGTSATSGQRARNRVVSYADAKADGNTLLVQEMEKLLEKIDRNPDSYEALAAYGSGPMQRLGGLAKDIQGVIAALPPSGIPTRSDMLAIEKIGVHRVELTRDINLYLGALPEALRRYNEEYIPLAHRNFSQSQDPEDELFLKDVMKRKEDLIGRGNQLEALHSQSVIVAQQLRQMLEAGQGQAPATQAINVLNPLLKRMRDDIRGMPVWYGGDVFEMPAANPMALKRPLAIKKPISFKQPAAV